MDESAVSDRGGSGPARPASPRWLAMVLAGVAAAVLAAAGIVGATRYVTSFWL